MKLWISIVLFGFSTVATYGQDRFRAAYREELTFPTLTPRRVLLLDFGDWNGIWAGFPKGKWDPLKETAPFHDPRRYYVKRVSDGERIPVERIDFACIKDDPKKPCKVSAPDYFSAYLVLNPTQLRPKDKVVVFLIPPGQAAAPSNDKNPRSNEVDILQTPRLKVGLDPSYIPSQELLNGKKRPVGHLGADLTISDIPIWGGFARSFFKTENALSTDGKDKSSKIETRWMVLERALPVGWYMPVQIETKALGNQTADNLSWVNSAGISGLIPWRWTRKAFYNEFFQVPVSPIWRLNAQHEYRARRDVEASKKFPDRNTFRLFGEMAWSPIRLLPSAGSDTLTLEMLGRGWYFPSDRNKLGVKIRRLEGLVEISILVPITKFSFTGAALVSDEKSKAKQRVRIKYSAGANEANGFQHSSQLSLGVEIVK
jgi:hypothetical protein